MRSVSVLVRTEYEFRLPFTIFRFPFSISHFLQMLLPVGRLKKLANCEQRSLSVRSGLRVMKRAAN